jgi:colanic acid biosynthesis glycosyl transferase WcaI
MAETICARGIPAERVQIVPNWCDDEAVFPVLHEENLLRREWQLDGKFVIAYSGNLGRSHEFDTVLAAAEILRDEPRLIFLFIGAGTKLRELVTRVSERSLDARFRFLPYQDRAVLRHSLGAADMHLVSLKPELEGLIVPSKFYGIAAAGRATIAITAMEGEIARLVRRHECGIVVEPGQGAMLAEILRNLMNDRDRVEAMGQRARAMLEKHFARRRAFARWHDIIEGITTEGSPQGAPAEGVTPIAKKVQVTALS